MKSKTKALVYFCLQTFNELFFFVFFFIFFSLVPLFILNVNEKHKKIEKFIYTKETKKRKKMLFFLFLKRVF